MKSENIRRIIEACDTTDHEYSYKYKHAALAELAELEQPLSRDNDLDALRAACRESSGVCSIEAERNSLLDKLAETGLDADGNEDPCPPEYREQITALESRVAELEATMSEPKYTVERNDADKPIAIVVGDFVMIHLDPTMRTESNIDEVVDRLNATVGKMDHV